jgi:DNA/RNA endonuclease YhcR with UshA esterase domain
VVNYKGNTPETQANGAYVYSINGTGGGTTPTPTEEVKKVTVAEFNAAAESATQYYQLTGTVKNLKDGDQYGNFDLEDATGSVYVYGLLAEKGGESKKFQELAAAKGIKNGVTLTINGLRSSYNNKVQVKSAYFVSVEAGSGGGGDTPSGDGDGTENNPYNVAAAIAKANQTGVFVKAFIVGFVDGQVYTEGANFSSASTTQTNILIAGSADEKNVANCMPVQLPTGDIRTKLNLKDNAGNYKKEVLLYGDITKYFGVPGLKNTSYAVIDGNSIGTNPNGGSGGGSSTDEVKTVSVADFIAASESDTQWYKLTGTVKNLKDGDQYGNFDIEDATGSVYVYGLLSEKGGEKKKFQELAAAKGIKNGSKITIIGLRSSYNGSVQVKNAYFVSIEEGGSSGGGGSTATGADGSTIISVADFNAAAESTSVWYQLTGTVKNLKDNDQYGNFDLEDSTGSVYVYGLLSEKGGAKKKFQDLVTSKGIANGKTITIVGNRGSYQGKIEVMNAYFIKIE